jgi:hypothetical protein
MLQAGCQSDFAEEAIGSYCGSQFGVQQLEGDRPLVLRISG